MKNRRCFIYYLAIASICCGCKHNQVTVEDNRRTEFTRKHKAAHNWEKKRFTIYHVESGVTSEVEGWSVRIANPEHPRTPGGQWKEFEMLHAFMAGGSRVPWVGSPQDIYLICKGEVIGVRLRIHLGIAFTPSMLETTDSSIKTFDALKLYIEKGVNYQAVLGHQFGMKGTNLEIIMSLIDLRIVFEKHLFHTESGGGNLEALKQIKSFKIADGTLKIDLTRNNGLDSGTVWIRIVDKMLLRAVENGVQVYPTEVK